MKAITTKRTRSTTTTAPRSRKTTTTAAGKTAPSARELKRSTRKCFNEIKKSALYLTSNIELLPSSERQAIRNMQRSMEATHSKLMQWWSN